MKCILLVLSFSSVSVWAQAPQPTKFASYYFDDVKKEKRIQFIEDNVYNQPRNPGQQPGCAELKRPQPAFDDVGKRSEEIITLINQKFSQAFADNPVIKEKFEKEMREVAKDKSCKEIDNICRGKLLATAMFHYENLRPDMPGCKGYAKQPADNKNYNRHCEIELKYRTEYLDTYSQGGLDARAEYTDQLVTTLNNVTMEILKKTLHKSLGFTKGTKKTPGVEVFAMEVPEICSKSPFVFNLRMNLYKEPIVALSPGQKEVVVEKKVIPCIEEKLSLYSEFVPLNFDEGRSEVGSAQIDPVKAKIKAFILANPTMVITDVSVTSSSSKTPYYTTGASGKKIIDPNSDQKNKDLAEQRAKFASTALNELKASNSELSKVNFETKFALAGPDFTATDLNNRFVTPQSPDYAKKVQAIFEANKELLANDALITSSADLMDQKRFINLYQAKYKPFQGFRINISGYKKESMKCGDKSTGGTSKGSSGSSTKGSNQ